jgi:hypothetical protein
VQAMLIAIITILFLGGGASTGWLYDFGDMKAQTKAVIADDERKDAALDVVKEFKARSKAENKRLKALSKQVKNAVTVADVEGNDAQVVYLGNELLDNTRSYYKDLLDLRFELKQNFTRDEWAAAYAD